MGQEVWRELILHLPTSDIDTHLLQAFERWNNYLSTYKLEISTGPVVPFRAIDKLAFADSVKQGKAVPLLWLQHVRRMDIQWPLAHFDKPYVTAFLSFAEFKRHAPHIAWETEVWIAETPEHMIHYNGDKFLGPHK